MCVLCASRLQEVEKTEVDPDTKKRKKIKVSEYEFDAEMEPVCG